MQWTGILLLISTFLCSCASLEGKQRDSDFDTATTQYARAIRWGDFEGAEQMRHLSDSQTATPPPGENIKVAGYHTLRLERTADGNVVKLTVRIDYYNQDEMKLKNITDQQVWKYDSDDRHWHITSALPEFK
jgi:hypothetical protein